MLFSLCTRPPPCRWHGTMHLFIDAGLVDPEPCPVGTYGNTTGVRQISDCTDCTPGYYCDQRGLTNPSGLCDPGYYCLDGSYTSAPSAPGSPLSADETDIGGLCPGTRKRPRWLSVRFTIGGNRLLSPMKARNQDQTISRAVHAVIHALNNDRLDTSVVFFLSSLAYPNVFGHFNPSSSRRLLSHRIFVPAGL